MTGFGNAKGTTQDHKSINVEIKSLNSKLNDFRMRIPENYRSKEFEIRRYLSDEIVRGKLDVSIVVTSTEGDEAVAIDKQLFKKYYYELNGLAEELNLPQTDMLYSILRIPNVIKAMALEISDEEWSLVTRLISEAIEKLKDFRLVEGAVIEADMRKRAINIFEFNKEVKTFDKERKVALREKIHRGLGEGIKVENLDTNRFEQELMYYLERLDITEELVRLSQHCKYFLEELDTDEPIKGKKLNFISQEIGREINTLGAKAQYQPMQKVVVMMKDELEKIKEQINNVL